MPDSLRRLTGARLARFGFWTWLVWFVGSTASAVHSAEPVADKQVTGESQPAPSPLESSAQKMRDFLKEMRLLAVKYHLSDAPADVKKFGADWRKMLADGRRIHDDMLRAAIEEFRAKPDLNSTAGMFLIQVSGRNADADRFENMYEVVQLLQLNGLESKSFDLCYGLTAAANNQYADAKPKLQTAAVNIEASAKELAAAQKITDEERKAVAKKMIQMYEMVQDLSRTELYEAYWQQELKAREEDAAGEPLPRVLIETSKGDLVVELYENNAPNTVANFIELCEKGFYNGLPFHRVMTHFMAQGGDPARDGSGGPGYAIPTELNGKTDRNFFRGTLGMAMSNLPNSGGSQFFICYLPRATLNGKYVAFGRVIEGMHVVSDFAHIDPDDKEAENSRQSWPDEIISTKVLRKRAHEYKVTKLPEAKPTAQPHDHAH